MAKNYKYNNSHYGWFVKFIAFFMCLVIIAGGVLTWVYWDDVKSFFSNTASRVEDKFTDEETPGDENGSGNQNEKPDDGENPGENETPGENEQPGNGEQSGSESVESGHLKASTEESMGVGLMMLAMDDSTGFSIPEGAENAIQVTATVYPEYATDKSLTWELSFKEPEINEHYEWLREIEQEGHTVDEYVKVFPSSENNGVATIACYAPFGATIQLKVASSSNPDAYATVDIGYRVRLLDVGLTFTGFGGVTYDYSMSSSTSTNYHKAQQLEIDETLRTIDRRAWLNLTSNQTVGTYAYSANVVLRLSTSFVTYMQNRCGLIYDEDFINNGLVLSESSEGLFSVENFSPDTYVNFYYLGLLLADIPDCPDVNYGIPTEDWSWLKNNDQVLITKYQVAVNEYVSKMGLSQGIFSIEINYGNNLDYPEQKFGIVFGSETPLFNILPDSVTTDQEDIIF